MSLYCNLLPQGGNQALYKPLLVNITPLDADQFTRGYFSFHLFCYFLDCLSYVYFHCIVLSTIYHDSCISHYSEFCNKLDNCWRLPPLTVVFALLLIIEMFSIRLSEAKENRKVGNNDKNGKI